MKDKSRDRNMAGNKRELKSFGKYYIHPFLHSTHTECQSGARDIESSEI